MKEQIKRIDAAIYKVEQAFVVAALAVMSIVVFLDVVHRTFGSTENKAVSATIKLLSYFGQEIEVGTSTYASLETTVPYLLWPAFVGIGYLAVRTANREEKVPRTRAFIYSAVGVVAVYGVILLFLRLMPNGVIWSQPLALVLTLWVGFIAASMCTYEAKHLKVEAVQRVLPAKIKPVMGFISAMFTAFVCICLLWLSMRYVAFNYDEYVATDGKGGVFQGLDLPKFVCFLALPISFASMTIRFGMRGIAALRGELPEATIEGMDALEKQRVAERAPSDVPTEVSDRGDLLAADKDGKPSETPTEVVPAEASEADAGAEEDAVVPQSQVSTDTHSVPEGNDDERPKDDEDDGGAR